MNPINPNVTETAQASISTILTQMNSGWQVPLMFRCQLKLTENQALDPHQYVEQDLHYYIGSNLFTRTSMIYFDPVSYPPPVRKPSGALTKEDQGVFDKLKIDLQTAALESGQEIVCNGSTNGRSRNRVFNCKRNRIHKSLGMGEQISDDGVQSKYRETLYHNNRTKSRGPDGQKQAKRTRTERPTDESKVCLYRCTVKWDDEGYYVSLGSGCVKHIHHPQLRAEDLAYPSRLLQPHEREVMESIHAARINDGAGRMVFQERIGHYIHRSKFRHITSRSARNSGSSSVANVSSIGDLISDLKDSTTNSWAILYDEIVDLSQVEGEGTEETQETLGVPEEVLIQETNVSLTEIPEKKDGQYGTGL